MTRKEYQQLPTLSESEDAAFMDARSNLLEDHPWMQEMTYSVGTDDHQDYRVCCRRFARACGVRLCSLDDYKRKQCFLTPKGQIAADYITNLLSQHEESN
jgi:hypothetical protein